MGTNYYVKDAPPCPTCKQGGTEIHLGKSSGGWAFHFQYNGGEYYKTIVEMREWLRSKQIWNEYEEKVSFDEFWDLVEAKQEEFEESKKHWDEHPGNTFYIDGYCFSDHEFC